MIEVSFTIHGKPMTWARARKGRHGPFYLEEDRLSRMTEVKDAFLKTGAEPFGRGISLVASMQFYFMHPDSHYGTGRNAGVLKPQYAAMRPGGGTNGGDLDNLIKLVKDALNQVAYHDDTQITEYENTFKAWCAPGEMPRTEVRFRIWVPSEEELHVGDQAQLVA